MDALLNETTLTVHRLEDGRHSTNAACGATAHVSDDRLQETTVGAAIDDVTANKCGRCFDDGGGY